MTKEPEKETKKGFPGSFLIFLLVAVLIALTVQNFLGTKMANVSFSYQVQHLANLQLVSPQDSRMTALNDNLVTFSGKFRERLPESASKRFKYLNLLDKEDNLVDNQRLIADELKSDRKAAMNAAQWFLQLAGIPLSSNGYQVFGVSASAPEGLEPIVITSLPNREVVSLTDLQEMARRGDEKELGSNLALLIQNFRSPALGIGQEKMKETLRALDKEVTAANRGVGVPSATYAGALSSLQNIVGDLNTPKEGAVLTELRSVRNFRDSLNEYEANAVETEQVNLQLAKARGSVSSVIWFFNDKELSSRALEREDPELYDHWFQQAKREWQNFQVNKGLSFRAVDQPRNLVLERTFKSEAPSPNFFKYLPIILMVGLLLMLLYFVFARQMKGMGNNAMSFGKSPAKMLGKGMSDVTFADVAGCDEAKEELQEIIEFLRSPTKFTALGGRIPKGVLCIGPPGTGKTLIAKAVAGEANRPFFSISGSDFVEMFVGVGASRIRDLFSQAKKHAPCIIFIDEIDAVGRHRGGGYGGGHDEREQTLNQLLVEMDGFDSNEGVILMAATNRPDVLDKALLRPGRFDRRVTVDLPDIKGRYQILKVHARKIKIDPTVDLMAIAKMTPGASGADLGNLLNEAALMAARKGRSAVTPSDTLEAADKVRYGKERRSLEISEEEKRTTAYHESGHAIVGAIVEHSDPVDKVTIIPRGFSLGATHFLPQKNRLSYWKREVLDQLAVAMGGRVAEEIFVGDVSSGAQQDISQATNIARSMVTQWGMSDNVGLVDYADRSEGQFMGMGGQSKTYSEATAEAIDKEVRRLCAEGHQRALDIITEHRDKVELMTQMLMEFETLDAEDVKKIMDGTWNSDDKREKMQRIETLHCKVESTPEAPPEEIEAEPRPKTT